MAVQRRYERQAAQRDLEQPLALVAAHPVPDRAEALAPRLPRLLLERRDVARDHREAGDPVDPELGLEPARPVLALPHPHDAVADPLSAAEELDPDLLSRDERPDRAADVHVVAGQLIAPLAVDPPRRDPQGHLRGDRLGGRRGGRRRCGQGARWSGEHECGGNGCERGEAAAHGGGVLPDAGDRNAGGDRSGRLRDEAAPHRPHRDEEQRGRQHQQPGAVPEHRAEVRIEDQRAGHVDQVVERREPRHRADPAGQLVERIEDSAEEEQRRDEEREVVRVEVHARIERGEADSEHPEARAAEREEGRDRQCPRRADQPEGGHDREERASVDDRACGGPRGPRGSPGPERSKRPR